MELTGRVIQELPLQSGVSKAGNEWKKQSWILETLTQYPRKVKVDVFGNRLDQFRLEVGKTYTVSVDAESREFNGRWYTDISAYAAREDNGMGGQPAYAAPAASAAPQAPFPAASDPFGAAAPASADPFAGGDSNDDLPF